MEWNWNWKAGMTEAQLTRVAALEAEAGAMQTKPVVIVTEGGEAKNLTPNSSPTLLKPPSPSLQSLHPGYVNSLASFWADKWRKSPKSTSDHDEANEPKSPTNVEESNNFSPEESDHIQNLKRTIGFLEEFLRTEESKVLMLQQQVEVLAKEVEDQQEQLLDKDSIIDFWKDKVDKCADKVTRLLREDLEKNYRIISLEGQLDDARKEKKRIVSEPPKPPTRTHSLPPIIPPRFPRVQDLQESHEAEASETKADDSVPKIDYSPGLFARSENVRKHKAISRTKEAFRMFSLPRILRRKSAEDPNQDPASNVKETSFIHESVDSVFTTGQKLDPASSPSPLFVSADPPTTPPTRPGKVDCWWDKASPFPLKFRKHIKGSEGSRRL